MTAGADSKGRRNKMAKFKAGDVVEIISGLNKGERGTVGSPNAGTENGKTLVSVYGDVKYIVPEDWLRLANAARNAKFKVGDRVTDGSAIYAITDIDDGIYEWKVVSGKADPSYSKGGEFGWAEHKMRLANASPVRSTNAVVRNALAAQNATMGEIKAQLNPAKIKEAYQQMRKAADGLERCIPALKASNIAKAWPRIAEMYGEARSKLNNLLMQFEGELQDMIR